MARDLASRRGKKAKQVGGGGGAVSAEIKEQKKQWDEMLLADVWYKEKTKIRKVSYTCTGICIMYTQVYVYVTVHVHEQTHAQSGTVKLADVCYNYLCQHVLGACGR